jgi:ribosome-associated protein
MRAHPRFHFLHLPIAYNQTMPEKQALLTASTQQSAHDIEEARQFAIQAARRCADLHCEDVVLFDVTGLSPLTSFIVIATGTSDRQIKSLADDLAELGAPLGFERFGNERDDSTTWLVADFVDVVVHLFEPATRAHYDLEMLWGDAQKTKWRRG